VSKATGLIITCLCRLEPSRRSGRVADTLLVSHLPPKEKQQ